MDLHEQSLGTPVPTATTGPLRAWTITLLAIGLVRLVFGWLANGDNIVAYLPHCVLAAIQGPWNHHWPLVLMLDILGWAMLACLPVGFVLLGVIFKKGVKFAFCFLCFKRGVEFAFCFLIAFLVIAMLYAVFAKARESGRNTCFDNLCRLTCASQMYCQDHEDHFPAQWSEIYKYLGADYQRLLVCPSAKYRYHSWGGYGYNAYLKEIRIDKLDKPDSLLATADSIHPEMLITSLQDIANRHAGGYCASFIDGHGAYLKGVPVRLK